MIFKAGIVLLIAKVATPIVTSTSDYTALAAWDAFRSPADNCNRLSSHDKEICVCDNMETPSKKQDECYEKRAKSFTDCLKISRTNQLIFDHCREKHPQAVSNDWKTELNNCKNLPSPSEISDQCNTKACSGIGDANARDQCWDSVSAPCNKRSTSDSRDKCHESRKECRNIDAQSRRDSCYSKNPRAPGNPNPKSSRPTPKSSSVPRSSPAPRSSPSPWAAPPANNNPVPWISSPTPVPATLQCNNDQSCYQARQCEKITGNLDMRDSCFLEKHDCSNMIQQIAKDFCFACARACNSISGNTPESQGWKQSCNRRALPDRCPAR